MERGSGQNPFDEGLIVTEADKKHPCIAYMMKTFPGRIKIQSGTVLEDACTIRSARNLAISFGTWGTALVMLNDNIRNLYMPESMRTPLMHGPDGLPCTTFAFPGY